MQKSIEAPEGTILSTKIPAAEQAKRLISRELKFSQES